MAGTAVDQERTQKTLDVRKDNGGAEDAITVLTDSIDKLSIALDCLTTKMKPFLSTFVRAELAAPTRVPSGSFISGAIRDRADRIVALGELVNDLTGRVDA